MSTDLRPHPTLHFDDVYAALSAMDVREVVSPPAGMNPCMCLTVDDKDFVWCIADDNGSVGFTRFGRNDHEPVLRAIEAYFSVVIGPEHERYRD